MVNRVPALHITDAYNRIKLEQRFTRHLEIYEGDVYICGPRNDKTVIRFLLRGDSLSVEINERAWAMRDDYGLFVRSEES